jgi:hypothetical protein
MSLRISDDIQLVPILEANDLAGGAGTCDSVDVKNARRIAFVFMFGDITGNSVLKVRAGATNGATTEDLTFSYRTAGADTGTTGSDVLAAETTSAALTLTAATYDHTMLVVEIDLENVTDTYHFLTPNISAVANPCDVSCMAIIYPKYRVAATAV